MFATGPQIPTLRLQNSRNCQRIRDKRTPADVCHRLAFSCLKLRLKQNHPRALVSRTNAAAQRHLKRGPRRPQRR